MHASETSLKASSVFQDFTEQTVLFSTLFLSCNVTANYLNIEKISNTLKVM